MKTMDLEIRPRGPVIPSQLTAQHLIDKWVRENNFSSLKDGDGTSWDLELIGKEIPDPGNPYGLIWEITFVLRTVISIDSLIGSGVLEREHDERMIQLLGAKKIPFEMKPKVFVAKSELDVRKMVTDALPILRNDLSLAKLMQVKRKMLGRWLDTSRLFG